MAAIERNNSLSLRESDAKLFFISDVGKMRTRAEYIDVLVIGAGQAGLALGYHLQSSNLKFRIIEKHPCVGDSWRKRYDSLTLFTPRKFSALPGMTLSGEPNGFPTKDEIADYLADYSKQFSLPITTNTSIQKLSIDTDDSFAALTSTGETILSKTVVVATGAFQKPLVPAIAKDFSTEVLQLTTDTYRSPNQISGRSVLVVGDGATGRQIAVEVASKASVILATGHPRRILPDRILGKSIFWWLKITGLIKAGPNSFIGQRIKKADAFPGKHLSLSLLEKVNVRIVGKLIGGQDKYANFTNGQTAHVDAVIWAVGYGDETKWLDIPNAKDEKGHFLENKGISPVKGLYYIGRNWQTSRGSSLLLGVGDDARMIVDSIFCHIKDG